MTLKNNVHQEYIVHLFLSMVLKKTSGFSKNSDVCFLEHGLQTLSGVRLFDLRHLFGRACGEEFARALQLDGTFQIQLILRRYICRPELIPYTRFVPRWDGLAAVVAGLRRLSKICDNDLDRTFIRLYY